MPRFDITVREVWNQTFIVHAENREEAIKAMKDCGGETMDGSFEFNRMLDDSDDWDVVENDDD